MLLKSRDSGLQSQHKASGSPSERQRADTTGLTNSNAKILNQIYVTNFIKQHSETDTVWQHQNADCSLRKNFHCVIYYNFRHTFVPYRNTHPFSGPLSRVSGSGISWAICMSAPRSRQITTPTPHHSVFYRPDALPAAQPTASKHWRNPTVSVPKTFIEAARHWSVPVNGKEQSQCRDGLLPARQVVHRPEPLTWRHAVVIDAVQVRLLGVLRTQERLRALVLRQRLSTHRHSAVYSTLRA